MRKTNGKETTQGKLDSLYGMGEYSIIGNYISTSKKVLIEHKCGFQWEVIPANLYSKKICPGCKLSYVCEKPKTLDERNSINEKEISTQTFETSYLKEGFIPKKYNRSFLEVVRTEPAEMNILFSQKEKFKHLPIIF